MIFAAMANGKEAKTMREILFRGKRLDNGEWVYGSFIQVEHEDGSFTTAIFQKKDAADVVEVVRCKDCRRWAGRLSYEIGGKI